MDITSILNDMITSGSGLLLVAAAYLLSWASAFIPNLFSPKAWNWKKGLEDFAKAFLMGLVLIAGTGILNLGSQFFYGLGWDITGATEAISTFALIGAMSAGFVFYIGKAAKNAWGFFNLKKSELAGDKAKFDEGSAKLGQEVRETIGKIFEAEELNTEEGLAEATLEAEKEEVGGRGRYYPISIGSYDQFRTQVLGNGFDIDGAYGNQCWDGCALLWQQIGRTLQTGNGCAYGCWTLKRDANAGSNFELIANKANVKRGDVVVFQGGKYGHIGFADENYNGGAYIRLMGQNQGGANGNFNVINMSMAGFIGAFRFKPWQPAANNPAPQPTTPQKTNEQIADEVIAGKWGNDPERTQRLKAAGYNRDAIQAIVDAKLKPAKRPAPAPKANEIKVSSTVVPTRLVDYNGTPVRQYDPSYTVIQLTGNRAVLSARGSIWAAMRTQDLKLV